MTDSSHRFFVRATLFELGLGIVAVVVGRLIGYDPLLPLEATWFGQTSLPAAIVCGIAATVPMCAGLLLLDRYPIGPLADLQRFARTIVVPLFAQQSVWQLTVLSAAAGIGEEVLFRGLIQRGLASWLSWHYRDLVACLVASLLFGLCHWLSATYAVLATLVGLYLGLLYLATGTLLARIIAHGLYDFFALVYLVKWTREPGNRAEMRYD